MSRGWRALITRVKVTIRKYGEDVTISRPIGLGEYEEHIERVLYVPLTPTFAHDLQMEGSVNVLENDQSDFIVAGDADITENDEIAYGGCRYRITTVAPSVIQSHPVSLHCLALRVGEE